MEHTHLDDFSGLRTHDHEADPTHYPPAPSMVEQAMAAYRRHQQLLRDMTPEQFIEYNEARHAERVKREATPWRG